MPDKPVNRRIPYFGDFVLFDEIGRGGMGVVYSAQQTKLDRPVALKVLHSGFASGESGIQRLRIEAEATAKLDHPNIVPIYEFGQHEGHPYLAMQLIEGESLAEYIASAETKLNERDAALLMAKIARAVHHAHERGVLHRDLKPGNILLDENGEPHLIDFGLAKCLEQDSGLTQTGAFLGTPAYASPEQAAGQNKSITTASDVYSLGAILYALLTGRPPFDGQSVAETIEKVKHTDPPRPRSVRPGIPANLEIICLKCLAKEPAQRYVSALELAEELGRFLAGKPILARPVGTIERLWMWTRRNPVHAALWVTVSLTVLISLVWIILWRDLQARQAVARSQLLQRQLFLQETQAGRLSAHTAGWSTQAWERVVKAGRISTGVESGDLRDQAAALLAGLDAHRVDAITNFGASSVHFDREGKRLLIGGSEDGVKLWDDKSNELQTFSHTNSGPLAFTPDGVPVELDYDTNRHSLTLLDIVNSRRMREWRIPERIGARKVNPGAPVNISVSPDTSCFAAAWLLSDGTVGVVVSQADVLAPLEAAFPSTTALAVSPDGSLVGVAEPGSVSIWSARNQSLVVRLATGRNEVLRLAFHHSPRVAESVTDGASDWLVAAGDAGGKVSIWNLRNGTEMAHCRGGHLQVSEIAFSPDGATLASGGRGQVKLWDVATGRFLLDLPVGTAGEFITGLDFAPDGKRVAISTRGGLGLGKPLPRHVSIWELESGRGIQTFRGLSGQISKVCFSQDGRKLAALSHDWEIGVWDLNTGQLLRVFDVPTGDFADNAAIALSPNGERLVFSASRKAKMWNVGSGAELNSWELWPGFVDVLSFPEEDRLLLLRVETLDARRPPYGNAPPADHPRVCRIRNLLNAGQLKTIAEIPDFNWQVFNTSATRDGRVFLVDGQRGNSSEHRMMINAYDALTGKNLWSFPSAKTGGSGRVSVDATGRFVAFQATNSIEAVLVNLETGALVKALPYAPAAIGPGAGLYAVGGGPSGDARGCTLFNDTMEKLLISLGIDGGQAFDLQFDATGNQLAWGNANGTVTVCDLEEVHSRLVSAGVGW